MLKINYYNSKYLFPLLIVLISLFLALIWLKDGLVISYAESGFTLFLLNPFRLLKLNLYSWIGNYALGADWSFGLTFITYYSITSVMQYLGLSAIIRQYLIFGSIITLSGLFMYFLGLELFYSEKIAYRYISFLASLFYILNPFTMNWIWHRFVSSIYGLPLMPLILLVLIKLIKKPSFKYVFLFAVSILFFSVNANNSAYFIPLFIPSFIYLIFIIIESKKARLWKYFGALLFLSIALNFWWILPQLFGFSSILARASIHDNFETLRIISSWSSPIFIMRLLDDAASINWYNINYHPGWIEFLIPILAGTAVFLGRRNKVIIFFALLLIIGLFLSKGIQAPFGFIFSWLFRHINFLIAFRSPLEKFGLIIAFSYSFLVSYAIYELARLIKNRILKFGVTLVILSLLFIVIVWPMWTGDVFSFYQGAVPAEAKNVPSVKVEIPAYWYEAADFINSDKSFFRILFLPQSPTGGMWYEWEHGYAGSDWGSVNLLFDNPVIQQTYPAVPHVGVAIKDILSKQESGPASLGLLNVRYIIVRNDINESVIRSVPLNKIHDSLDNFQLIKKIRSFGKLDLYMVLDKYFFPHIYSLVAPTISRDATKLILANSAKIITKKDMCINCAGPKIIFNRINPTKYLVKVRDANNPFWLVFSESFHKEWKLYAVRDKNYITLKSPDKLSKPQNTIAEFTDLKVVEEKGQQRLTPEDVKYLFRKPLDASHQLVNGYANGWYVESEKLGLDKDFTLVIHFWPQSLFYLGLIISGATFIGCIGYLCYSSLRRKKVKRRAKSREPRAKSIVPRA